jgi:hypothetical protein
MNASIGEASRLLAEYETQKNPDRLGDAADRLQQIVLADSPDPDERRALRREALVTWLALFAAIDASLDPHFNPADLPSLRVDPPRSNGVQFPPGVDPSVITDPVARREYERLLAENDEKTESYNRQTKLRRLDDRLTPRLATFIRSAYSSINPDDQREVGECIGSAGLTPKRADSLRRLSAP